jgi:hypothetical protein
MPSGACRDFPEHPPAPALLLSKWPTFCTRHASHPCCMHCCWTLPCSARRRVGPRPVLLTRYSPRSITRAAPRSLLLGARARSGLERTETGSNLRACPIRPPARRPARGRRFARAVAARGGREAVGGRGIEAWVCMACGMASLLCLRQFEHACAVCRVALYQPHLRSGLGTQATTTAVVWRSLRFPVLTQAQGRSVSRTLHSLAPAVLFRSWPTPAPPRSASLASSHVHCSAP